jgi:hypothetical protein
LVVLAFLRFLALLRFCVFYDFFAFFFIVFKQVSRIVSLSQEMSVKLKGLCLDIKVSLIAINVYKAIE